MRHVDVKPAAVKQMVVSFTVVGVTCRVPADEFCVVLFYASMCHHVRYDAWQMLFSAPLVGAAEPSQL